VLGVGGGITTDVTGFAASIYKRGVKFAFVPTTLLAQVDASIGGKNGVNLLSYKNILGTITQPEWIFICPQLLATLPENEFKAGIAEVLKTFILFDKEYYRKAVGYFAAISPKDGETYGAAAVGLDGSLLAEIIGKCAKYKSEVVERDEFERGERRMLNLGHTFAHSIERLAGGEISHGYAVSMGMVIAAKIGDYLKDGLLGNQQGSFTQMLIDDLRKVGLPALLDDCPITKELKISQLADAVSKDKKVQGKNIHFIVPNGIEDVKDITIELDKIKQIANDLR
jgi:3-dehydroquinate synthase